MKIRSLLIAATAIAAAASAAHAQTSANTTVPTKVKIIAPITVTANGTELNFGTVSRSTGGSGTVSVSTAGARTLGTASGVALAGGTISNASLTVGGTASENFQITATDVSFGTGLTVKPAFTGGTNSGGNTTGNAIIGVGGTYTLDIGGDLEILSTATATGAQTGSMTVTVLYQ